MGFIEALQQIIVSILVGYLAFTNYLADTLLNLLSKDEEIVADSGTSLPDPNYTNLPSNYEYGGPIPRILIENSGYQEAAIGAAVDGGDDKNKDSRSPEERIEDALVNIFCQHKTDEYIRTTTGSGFFISKKGVVLTNAHVAQFLLLNGTNSKIKDSECVIRAGNPAKPIYKAELLYISPAWVHHNAKLVSSSEPRGTGERDYALLYVSEAIGKNSLPAAFSYLPIDVTPFTPETRGLSVYAGGYPASALFEEGSDATLRQRIAQTEISEIYTFGTNLADIFAIGATRVGEQGASGGPVIKENGKAVGLIVTRGDDSSVKGSSLRALTMEYINRTIKEETGYTLAQNMQGDLAFRSNVFKRALVPFLSELLTNEIK